MVVAVATKLKVLLTIKALQQKLQTHSQEQDIHLVDGQQVHLLSQVLINLQIMHIHIQQLEIQLCMLIGE